MLLEKEVPLGNSILHRLSQATWRRGLVNFFIENIPFSFSTSREYAQYCTELIDIFQQHHRDQELVIMEVGAGVGLFAKNCIKKCQEKEIECQYYLSEYTKELTDELANKESLESVASLVQYETFDITQTTLTCQPSIMIMTYILGTLPGHCIEIESGNCYEWVVSTTIHSDAQIIDSTQYPFQYLDALAIKQWLNQPIKKEKLPLLSRVKPCLAWEWNRIQRDPIALDNTGILQRVIDKEKESHFFCHFSPLMFQSLDHCLTQCKEESMIILHDFAHSKPSQAKSKEHCFGEFGACQFYNVPLFIINQWCKEKGVHFSQSSYEKSENQMGIIMKNGNKRGIQKIENQLKEEEPGEKSAKVAEKIKESKTIKEVLSIIKKSGQILTKDQQHDYVYLVSIANKCLEFNAAEEALLVLEQVVEDYQYSGLTAMVLLSKCYRQMGQKEKALTYIESTIKREPTYELLYLEKAFILSLNEQYEENQRVIKQYFKYATAHPQWHLEKIMKMSIK